MSIQSVQIKRNISDPDESADTFSVEEFVAILAGMHKWQRKVLVPFSDGGRFMNPILTEFDWSTTDIRSGFLGGWFMQLCDTTEPDEMSAVNVSNDIGFVFGKLHKSKAIVYANGKHYDLRSISFTSGMG